jgi:hypothetical protein
VSWLEVELTTEEREALGKAAMVVTSPWPKAQLYAAESAMRKVRNAARVTPVVVRPKKSA